MEKKMVLFFAIVTVIFTYTIALAEEITLTTLYPAPYGAYISLMVKSKQPDVDNTITRMRIDVDANDIQKPVLPQGVLNYVYKKSLLEVGGIAWAPLMADDAEQNNDINKIDDCGIYTKGEVGILAESTNGDGPAVFGYSPSNVSTVPAISGYGYTMGVEGQSIGSFTGIGVSGAGPTGVYGKGEEIVIETTTYGGVGVHGEGSKKGVYGKTTQANAYGVYGEADVVTSYGVYGKNKHEHDKPDTIKNKYVGIFGVSSVGVAGSGNDFGVFGYGSMTGVMGESNSYGIKGIGGQAGVVGISPSTVTPVYLTPAGVLGASEKYGVYAYCNNSNAGNYALYANGGEYAGYFGGDVHVNGKLTAVNKQFLIDHPINKDMLLRHSCMEGPEAGIYQRGRVRLENKEAIVELPDYFKALCKDTPTISLTPVGALALVSYEEVERGKKYRVFSDKDNIEIDWIIIAKRDSIIVEEVKKDEK